MQLSWGQQEFLGVLSPGFGGTVLPDYIKEYLDQGLGAITLFGSNTPDLETTAQLVAQIRAHNPGCIVSIDEESGDVTRIWAKSGSPFPSPYLLGRVDDLELTEQVYRQLGGYLAEADIDVTFGPVLDLVVSNDNPIVGVRSFGNDAARVTRHGLAAIRGLESAGIAASPKHLPGHGKTSADSHHNLPTLDVSLDELLAEDLAPFIAAIEMGVPAIMMGHLLVPAVDSTAASLSSNWYSKVLRARLGFKGVAVTDALDMGALGGLDAIHDSALIALRAGANLLCLSGIQDQSEIVARILSNAKSKLSDADLENIAVSKQKLQELQSRKSQDEEAQLPDLLKLAAGLERRGSLKINSESTAVLSLEAEPTIASGTINWGLEASLTSLGCEAGEFDTAKTQVVQFRDAWRDPVILERLEMVKSEHPDAIFVDFGWPTVAFEAKNLVRAFGATRAHSDTVARLMLGI